uniref:Protein FAM221A n=1 Tax=Sinocyclocheilus grahami TaxID=75366 RepID=A0A672S871_SINGR
MEKIFVDKHTTTALEVYLEYRRIVGEDDGGRLFSEEEYKKYKETVVPRRIQNRLYVSFGVLGQIDCKLIGPETPCFCTHRYRSPAYTLVGCQCVSYKYVHINGSKAVRCQCKHTTTEHSETIGHQCKKCTHCTGYQSPFTCGCGQPGYAHVMLVETREEPMARGHPVGRAVPYVAMGGLTGFSSLEDGYLRLDPSGIGNTCEQHTQ